MNCWFRGIQLALVTALLLTGCGEPDQPGTSTTPADGGSGNAPAGQQEPAVADSTASAGTGVVELKTIDPQGFENLLAEHQDQVVFVDFWATWCIPCQVSFPHTVEWSRKYADKGLQVVSISMDESDEDTKSTALAFLQKQQATFPNYIAEFDDLDTALEAWGIDGGLPHYRLYRNGMLLKKFAQTPDGQAPSPEELETAIQQALNAGG